MWNMLGHVAKFRRKLSDLAIVALLELVLTELVRQAEADGLSVRTTRCHSAALPIGVSTSSDWGFFLQK